MLVKVILVIFALAIANSLASSSINAIDCNVANSSKVDCGHVGTNKQQCEASGCCWKPEGQNSQIPWCYHHAAAPVPPTTQPPIPAGQPFNATAIALMTKYFNANIDIQGDGGVVASPDTNTPGGSYYYHWMRDGALTMRAFMVLNSYSVYNPKMQSYAQWVLRKQALSDPNNIDVREEPKFLLPDGGPYTGGWCRPQNDGPALRAATLTIFANNLFSNGGSDYVKQYLWTGTSSYNGGAIKYDLDFVAQNYGSNTCDLWEEVQSGDFFWNRFNQRHALLLGAALATKMGDSGSASRYTTAAKAIEGSLNNHWNGNYVFEATNRQQDAAVIVAFNDGYADDGVFGPTDSKIAGTITTLNNLFGNSFAINIQDTKNGIPGMLYGRYQGDHYAGGNPWVLTTGALAQLYYRGATQTLLEKALPQPEALSAWRQTLNLPADYAIETPESFAALLANQGNAVLYRLRYHVENYQYHLPEQLDRNTGVPKSATDLTWSYATVLKAIHASATYNTLLQDVLSAQQ